MIANSHEIYLHILEEKSMFSPSFLETLMEIKIHMHDKKASLTIFLIEYRKAFVVEFFYMLPLCLRVKISNNAKRYTT